MTRKERLQLRNTKIKDMYHSLSQRHPEWRYNAIITKVAKEVFLSPRTIEAILRGEGCYQ